MKDRYFIVTVDTEEDNQWLNNSNLSTENSHFLPRFQQLCEKYYIKPVYLVTYKMAEDPFFVDYFFKKNKLNLCEIGMHMHAWSCPPYTENDYSKLGKPFITEYDYKTIESKVSSITYKLESTFNCKIVSTRSGRWALNDTYLSILKKHGYLIDCSVTPYIDWSKVSGSNSVFRGTNYKKFSSTVFDDSFIECPMTIIKSRRNLRPNKGIKNTLRNFKYFIFGRPLWLRVQNRDFSFSDIKYLVDNNHNDYLMFMIHSSELMPGCSPYFVNTESIEFLYCQIEKIFKYVTILKKYKSLSLKEYYHLLYNNGDEKE